VTNWLRSSGIIVLAFGLGATLGGAMPAGAASAQGCPQMACDISTSLCVLSDVPYGCWSYPGAPECGPGCPGVPPMCGSIPCEAQ
jgi:hypothetical protein